VIIITKQNKNENKSKNKNKKNITKNNKEIAGSDECSPKSISSINVIKV